MSSIVWKRDAQGLHADVPDGDVRVYVRRDGKSWRAAFAPLVEVAGSLYPDMSRPMETIDLADTQRMAKAVAEAFADEPWSDGSAQRRSTRAIQRAYGN